MILYISQDANNTPSISGGGGTYAQVGTTHSGLVGFSGWYGVANITSLSSATITITGLSSFAGVVAQCIANAATSSPFEALDAGFNSNGFNAAPISASFSTTGTDEVVLAGINASSGGFLTAPSTGYTIGQTTTANADLSTQYKVLSATFTGTTGAGTLSGNNNWDVSVVGIKGPAGAVAHNMPPVVY